VWANGRLFAPAHKMVKLRRGYITAPTDFMAP